MHPNRIPPVYLVELMAPTSEEVLFADIFARLDTALETAYTHVKAQAPLRAFAEVSLDEANEINGVGFFGVERALIACVTVYHMEFDDEVPTISLLETACASGAPAIQLALNELLGGAR